MTHSKLYEGADRELYTMETMVDRVVYWWFRYKGKRTEEGKDFDNSDLIELIHRLKLLHDQPELFRFNCPDMDDVNIAESEGDGK